MSQPMLPRRERAILDWEERSKEGGRGGERKEEKQERGGREGGRSSLDVILANRLTTMGGRVLKWREEEV